MGTKLSAFLYFLIGLHVCVVLLRSPISSGFPFQTSICSRFFSRDFPFSHKLIKRLLLSCINLAASSMVRISFCIFDALFWVINVCRIGVYFILMHIIILMHILCHFEGNDC